MAEKSKRGNRFMQDAVKPSHRGLFTRKARAAGKTVPEYAREKSSAPGTLGKEARLAQRFEEAAKRRTKPHRHEHRRHKTHSTSSRRTYSRGSRR
ncbi:MAG: hypothetical protein KGL39_40705 [Patescibacteria group bacterium]|nr:hypothetical protein [Patescibacteria group bacterium]